MFFKNMLFKNFFRIAFSKKFEIWSKLIQFDPNWSKPGNSFRSRLKPWISLELRNSFVGNCKAQSATWGTAAAAWEASLNIDDGRHLTPCLTLWPFISTILLTRATDDPFLFPLISLWAVDCSSREVECLGFNCERYNVLFSKVSAKQN